LKAKPIQQQQLHLAKCYSSKTKNTQEGNNYSWKQARESEKQKLATAATATAAGEKEEETDCSWRSKDKKRKNGQGGCLLFTGYKGTKMP
jgi:hypothetical protein